MRIVAKKTSGADVERRSYVTDTLCVCVSVVKYLKYKYLKYVSKIGLHCMYFVGLFCISVTYTHTTILWLSGLCPGQLGTFCHLLDFLV